MGLSGRGKLLIQKFICRSFLSTPGIGQMLIFPTEMNGNFTSSPAKGGKPGILIRWFFSPFFGKWLHTIRPAWGHRWAWSALISPTCGPSPPCPEPYFSPGWGSWFLLRKKSSTQNFSSPLCVSPITEKNGSVFMKAFPTGRSWLLCSHLVSLFACNCWSACGSNSQSQQTQKFKSGTTYPSRGN